MKRKKTGLIIMILMISGLFNITLGVSWALFNYTSTGNPNSVHVGRVYFNHNQTNTVTLINTYPITREEFLSYNASSSEVVISVVGDTSYARGLEYLVKVEDVVNSINDKSVPIGIDVSVTPNMEVSDAIIGTSDENYFANRGGSNAIYKILAKDDVEEDGKLVVGYIPEGSSGINGKITIKAFGDGDKVIISDTYTGNETDLVGTEFEWVVGKTVLTMNEWNTLSASGISFKVNVEAREGIWVEEPLTAFTQIASSADTTTQINFANASSSTNGQGIYLLKGTESDTYPIYYYRGAIDNNNVLFGGYCWQIIRTTETGGIKMIYNGLPDISGSGDNITYNCGKTRDMQDTIMSTTDLKKTSPGYYYADDYEIVSTSGNSVTYRLKSKTNPITPVIIANATDAASAIPTIATNYPYTCQNTTNNGTCTTLYKVDSYASGTKANVYSSLDRTIIGRSAFNTIDTSVSDIGYMNNTRFVFATSGWATDALFANSATWVTDHYELVDASVTTPDTNYHYSCNATTSDATCTSLRYVFYVRGTTKYYITLTNGDLIEDALYKMTGNGTDATKTKNNGYVLNQNNSTVKTAIENWFKTNLTNEENTSNPNYKVYLEDTVFCNDRSYKTIGNSDTYTQSGWNPNGGSLSTSLYFGTWNRYSNSWYSTSNVPALKNTESVPNIACPNANDRFTVSNTTGNGALTYPVGLLTTDEIILAGVGGNNASSSTYYLNTNDSYWVMNPSSFDNDGAGGLNACYSALDVRLVSYKYYGLRPVVSLRLGTEFEDGGDGTGTNPYVVKYN